MKDFSSLRMDGDDDDREEFEQDPDDEVDDQMEPEDDNENVGADAMMENGGAEEEGAGGGEEAGARKTTGYLTKYERARVLGTRALQIRCVAGTGGKNCMNVDRVNVSGPLAILLGLSSPKSLPFSLTQTDLSPSAHEPTHAHVCTRTV